MTAKEEQWENVFPVCDELFAETFSEETVFKFGVEELKIIQVFSANLGVAAPVWDAALCLCRYLNENPVALTGKKVIELGAGTGIVGILAAKLGADVTLTDQPHAIPQIENNVSANTPSLGWSLVNPTVLPLSWGLDHTKFSTDWDLVLGADIVYLSETYPLLLDTLAHLCRGGADIYLSSKMRREHGTHDFFENVLPQRFTCQLVCREAEQDINIYHAAPRKERHD